MGVTVREPVNNESDPACEAAMLRERVARLEQAAQTAEALSRLTHRVAEAVTAADLMDAVREESDRLLGWDCCYLVHRRPGHGPMRIVCFVDTEDGRKKPYPGEDLTPANTGDMLRRALAGRPVLINRKPGEPVSGTNPFGTGRLSASLMFTPVRCGEHVIGALSVQSYTPDRYGQADLDLLGRIADALTPAMERVHAEDERRQAEKLLRLQYDLSLALTAETTLSGALGCILDAVLRIDGIDCGGIYLVDGTTGELHLVAHRNLSSRFLDAVSHLDADSPQARQVTTAKPLYLAENEFGLAHPACGPEGIRAIGAVPLQHEGRLSVVVNVGSRSCPSIPMDSRRALEAVAAQAGAAVDRVRSRESLQQARDELNRRIEERTAELRTANERLRREIAERTNAEDALRVSEAKYRTLVETTNTGFVIVDSEGRVLDANAEYVRLTGRKTLTDILGRPVTDWTAEHDIARNAEEVRKCAAKGYVYGLEIDYVDTEGRFTPIEINARVLQVAEGTRIVTLCRDITDRRMAEQERARLDDQLNEAREMEVIGRIAGGIAHDFNNLMATVLGRASRLKARRLREHPDYADLVAIEGAAETAGRLAHQLLVYARGGKILPRLADFADIIRRVVDALRPALPETIRFDCRVDGGLGRIECDTTQVEQVIVNLCRNAVDAMPDGGHLVLCAENASLTQPLKDAHPLLAPGDYVCLAVQDTGVGMSPDTAARVFEPFFTTKPNGYGMGLAAAWGIVKSHGGAISLTTQPGKGSTFRVWLPRARNGTG